MAAVRADERIVGQVVGRVVIGIRGRETPGLFLWARNEIFCPGL